MSNADRSQYVETVTTLSEGELQEVFSAAVPPVCLLGGWAVHLQVTSGFQDAHNRPYIGSRDIDLGIHVNPSWSADELRNAPVATTLKRIETDLRYSRGRFGFYQQFHRESNDRLDEEAVRDLPAHTSFGSISISSQIRQRSMPFRTSLDFAHQLNHSSNQYSRQKRVRCSLTTSTGRFRQKRTSRQLTSSQR